jgi:Flp pilus assembly pilin Flp
MLRAIDDAAIRWYLQACSFLSGQRGQTLAEYSLLITVIAVAVVVLAMVAFRNGIADAWNSVIPCLTGTCP